MRGAAQSSSAHALYVCSIFDVIQVKAKEGKGVKMPLLALELLLQLTLVAVVCGFQTDLCGPSGAACNCRTGHGTVSLGTVDALIGRKLG